VDLGPGAALGAFTDGVIEAADRHGEPFGELRLRQELLRIRDQPPPDVLRQLQAAVRKHRGRAEAADDATLVLMSTVTASA
jgi:sigma-B regulation protein RsbU (phosphoserine phosphatase)